jgi:hypothetical protein
MRSSTRASATHRKRCSRRVRGVDVQVDALHEQVQPGRFSGGSARRANGPWRSFHRPARRRARPASRPAPDRRRAVVHDEARLHVVARGEREQLARRAARAVSALVDESESAAADQQRPLLPVGRA